MREIKNIAILTSGGDSPGMNAAIRAVTRTCVHYNISCVGIFRGYNGLIEGDMMKMQVRTVSHILGRGGTVLKSARSEMFRTKEGREKAFENIKKNKIDALITIGGNGTFTGAKIFHEEFGVPVIGIPGTIDNDLYGTDFTLGFDTATNTVVEAVDKIRDTATSHNRLFFVEVMGRDSGFIALRAGIAVGAIAVMLPEDEMSIEDLLAVLDQGAKAGRTSSIVIVAEGDVHGGAFGVAKQVAETNPEFDTRVTVLGHIQRGGRPSCMDRVLASRMGVAAVEGLMEGRICEMVGVVDDLVKFTRLQEALDKKVVPKKTKRRISKILSI